MRQTGPHLTTIRLSRALLRPLLAMKHCKRVDECIANFAKSTEYPSDQYIPVFIQLHSFLTAIDESHDLLHSSEANAVLIQTTQAFLQRQFELLKSSVEIMATERNIEISASKGLKLRVDR